MEETWQTIATYVLPRKASFTEVDPVTNLRRERFVLDSTAPRSLEMFASFLHTSLSPPTSMWFDIVVRGQNPLDAQRDIVIQKWVEEVKRIAFTAMTTGATNVYAALHEAYLDLGAFGTAVLYVEPAADGRLRFHNFHLGSVALGEGEDGEIDTLAREVVLTIRQARQKWPDRPLGKTADEAKPDELDKKLRFLHLIFPASDQYLVELLPEPQPDAPFYSVWLNMTDDTVVASGHYKTKPFMAPRWYRTRQEIYGRSPAMSVLGDVIMCNRMAASVLRGAEKLVDPPMVVPDGGLVSPLRAFPGGITYADGQIEIKPLLPPGASRIELGSAMIEVRQQAIREGFFVPLFITPESPVKTATQVMQEVDERNRLTAPMITRLHYELFTPLIKRVLSILDDQGQLPPPPAKLVGAAIDVEFISPVVASQRMMDGVALQRLFEALAPFAQVDQGVFDWINTDAVARILHMATGSPASALNTQAHVDAVRRKREEMEQAAVQQQQVLAAVEAGAKLQAAQRGGA